MVFANGSKGEGCCRCNSSDGRYVCSTLPNPNLYPKANINPSSASIATIIRIPYVHTLGDVDDFLYATTDIAIWSCSETGLSITAACCAVLRPLFREVLSSSRFLSSGNLSRMGPTFPSQNGTESKASRRGYKRSSSNGYQEDEEMTLQNLSTHGQKPGKDGKGFGTVASVWHADESDSDKNAQTGSSPLGSEIMVTRTRNVTLT